MMDAFSEDHCWGSSLIQDPFVGAPNIARHAYKRDPNLENHPWAERLRSSDHGVREDLREHCRVECYP